MKNDKEGDKMINKKEVKKKTGLYLMQYQTLCSG